MAEEKRRLPESREADEETMTFNDTCRDMTLVTDGEHLKDGIVELADKNEYVDEP